MKDWWERIGPEWRILLMFLACTFGPLVVALLAVGVGMMLI